MKNANATSQDNSEEKDMNQDLHELFLDELSDLQNAEKQLVAALPKMIKAANSDELRSALEAHLEAWGDGAELRRADAELDQGGGRSAVAPLHFQKKEALLREILTHPGGSALGAITD